MIFSQHVSSTKLFNMFSKHSHKILSIILFISLSQEFLIVQIRLQCLPCLTIHLKMSWLSPGIKVKLKIIRKISSILVIKKRKEVTLIHHLQILQARNHQCREHFFISQSHQEEINNLKQSIMKYIPLMRQKRIKSQIKLRAP